MVSIHLAIVGAFGLAIIGAVITLIVGTIQSERSDRDL